MKAFNKQVGQAGEEFAFQYLMKKGYTLIERNYHNKFGEIDLIMKDGIITVFVEVKTKIGLGFGIPEEMFGRGKYERVKRMATMYLSGRDVPCRIDMVAVVLDKDSQIVSIKHYENVSFI